MQNMQIVKCNVSMVSLPDCLFRNLTGLLTHSFSFCFPYRKWRSRATKRDLVCVSSLYLYFYGFNTFEIFGNVKLRFTFDL